MSLLINFGEIPVAVCSVVVSDCCAPGPIPDGVTERKRENAFRESHHLYLCNYAEIKVLKYLYSGWQKESPWRTVWNICWLGNEGAQNPAKWRKGNGKWRYEWEVNTKSSRLKEVDQMNSQLEWLFSRHKRRWSIWKHCDNRLAPKCHDHRQWTK